MSNDVTSLSELNAGSYNAGTFVFPTDENRVPRYRGTRNAAASVTETRLLEPVDHVITASIAGDAATTSFTLGSIPANCIVKEVTFSITTGATTASISLAIGISGTTGKYMTASTFTSSMDTAGVKTVTTLPIHETTARTVLATFSAAPEAVFRGTIAIRYIKVPAPVA